jgi:hypothetical protein
MCLERGPFSLLSTIEELIERKRSGYGLEPEIMAVEFRHTDHAIPPLSTKVGRNFADRRRSLSS